MDAINLNVILSGDEDFSDALETIGSSRFVNHLGDSQGLLQQYFLRIGYEDPLSVLLGDTVYDIDVPILGKEVELLPFQQRQMDLDRFYEYVYRSDGIKLYDLGVTQLSETKFAVTVTTNQELISYNILGTHPPRQAFFEGLIEIHADQISIIDIDAGTVSQTYLGTVETYPNLFAYQPVFALSADASVSNEGIALNGENFSFSELGLPEGFVPTGHVVSDTDIEGTNNSETLDGTEASEKIVAFAGDDLVFGLAGNDTIEGNAGNDTLDGGQGSDLLLCGSGNDLLFGHAGDTLIGGVGRDTYHVDDEDVTIIARWWDGAPATLVTEGDFDAGAAYVETLEGTEADQAIYGNWMNNEMRGGGGNDLLSGRAGDDTLFGNTDGATTLIGGDGADLYFVDSDDVILYERWWQDGRDTVVSDGSYSALETWIDDIVLVGTAEQARDATGNWLDNEITGTDGDNHLMGMEGDDTLDAGTLGNDTLTGGQGRDTFIVENDGANRDVIITDFERSTDILQADDVKVTRDGDDYLSVLGETGSLRIVDYFENEPVPAEGLGDSYYISGRSVYTHDDFDGRTTDLYAFWIGDPDEHGLLVYGNDAENAMFTFSPYSVHFKGMGGDDVFLSETDPHDDVTRDHTLEGGAGDDQYFIHASSPVIIEGFEGGGHDLVDTRLGFDARGIGVDDIFAFGDGDDVIHGNRLDNRIVSEEGNDTITTGGGDDTLTGGEGEDVFALSDLDGHAQVTDFMRGEDRLDIAHIIDPAGTEADKLLQAQAVLGEFGAIDGNDLVIQLTGEQSIKILNIVTEDETTDAEVFADIFV